MGNDIEGTASGAESPDLGMAELIRRLPVPVYRSAPDGELLAGNPALAELLGYASVDEMREKTGPVNSVYVEPEKRAVWLERIESDGVVHDFDVKLRRSDGSTVWVQDTARATFDEEGNLLFCDGALIDVTEKVKARKARDEFVAAVSHELRNPMTVLLGLAREMSDDYESFQPEERREIADVMARQAEDASWIVEDLLIAYREDVSEVPVISEPVDVGREVLRSLEGIDHKVDVVIGKGAETVVGDPRRIRQILRNLLTNAVKYGGDEVLVEAEARSPVVAISVCDSGEPLDAEEAQRIFEAYERGTGLLDAHSVGLGLSVARKLASLMGGDLSYGHDGRYSRFTVTLPASP